MARMRAAIFVEPGRIVLDDKPIPDVGPTDALVRITTTTICGTDVHILKGEYPVAPRPDRRSRAGRRHREARLGRDAATARASASSPAPSRRAATATPACAAAIRRTARARARVQGDGRLEVRQHDRRLPGRLRPRARRHGQSQPHPGRPDRRAGADVPRHHVDRLLRRRARRHPHRRHGRGLRAGADRPLRGGRREADGRDDHHRRRHRGQAAGDGARAGRRPRRRLQGRAIPSRRSCG